MAEIRGRILGIIESGGGGRLDFLTGSGGALTTGMRTRAATSASGRLGRVKTQISGSSLNDRNGILLDTNHSILSSERARGIYRHLRLLPTRFWSSNRPATSASGRRDL